MTKKLSPQELEELEARALANIVAKIAAGGVPTARESALLRKAADLSGPAKPAPAAEQAEPVELELEVRDRDKPWNTPGRLALIDLEPQVEQILLNGGPNADEAAVRWLLSKGADIRHARGCIVGIRERWRAVMDEPDRNKAQAAVYNARLEAAWGWAANKPVFNPLTGEVLTTEHGHPVTSADLAAVPKLLKLMAEFHGLNQPTKVAHLHGHMNLPPPAALSPADRAAEIERLLSKHRAALAAGRAPESPVAPLPTPEMVEGLDS